MAGRLRLRPAAVPSASSAGSTCRSRPYPGSARSCLSFEPGRACVPTSSGMPGLHPVRPCSRRWRQTPTAVIVDSCRRGRTATIYVQKARDVAGENARRVAEVRRALGGWSAEAGREAWAAWHGLTPSEWCPPGQSDTPYGAWGPRSDHRPSERLPPILLGCSSGCAGRQSGAGPMRACGRSCVKLYRLSQGASASREHRDVAQLGSALDWGSRGRRFESGRPDGVKQQVRSVFPCIGDVLTLTVGGPLGDPRWPQCP